MSKSTTSDMLKSKWQENKFVCVGLDSEYEKIPEDFKSGSVLDAIISFNKRIIDETIDLVCSYKPNSAFYEGEGVDGLKALEETVSYIRQKDSSVPIILDAKRGDIGNTNKGYVRFAFDELDIDAITVSPYLSIEALSPFIERKDKLIFVLARTSNPTSGEFQDLPISIDDLEEEYKGKFGDLADLKEIFKTGKLPLYIAIAYKIAHDWNMSSNLGLVVGATYPDDLIKIRKVASDLPILMPGVGSQGADTASAVKAGVDNQKQGIIINSSRGIIFNDDPRKACQELSSEIASIISSI